MTHHETVAAVIEALMLLRSGTRGQIAKRAGMVGRGSESYSDRVQNVLNALRKWRLVYVSGWARRPRDGAWIEEWSMQPTPGFYSDAARPEDRPPAREPRPPRQSRVEAPLLPQSKTGLDLQRVWGHG